MTAQHTTLSASAPPSGHEPSDRRVIDAALGRLPRFRTSSWQVERLPGGLTNRIYKVVVTGAAPVVARVSAASSGLLAIDRIAECHNADAAARAGVGPDIVCCDPDHGVTVVEWIDGRTFEAADLDDDAALTRVAELCRTLHAGPRFANDFDMFEVQRAYLAIVEERGFRLPPRYRDFLPQVAAIRAALAVHPFATVPCHNDLLAANIMAGDGRLWFIDYEYAGNNDPCFELGNVWSEADLAPERLEHLVGAYFGEPSPALIARARLLALMSKYGWTLWASIQEAVSDVGFDFWSWGMEKYDRAVAEFDGPDLARLITDVRTPH